MENEKRFIDANAFWNRLRQVVYDIVENDDFGRLQLGYSPDIIEEVLKQTPTVDAVEVVHGRWIDNTDERGFLCNAWRKCSVCGGLNYSKRPPYCPNCGADMRERKDNGNVD